jgi:hypothetical protein
MSQLDPLDTFDDELAATRRQLRRLEKLARDLKRWQYAQPRHLGPLFRLRKIRQRLSECEDLLTPGAAEPMPPSQGPVRKTRAGTSGPASRGGACVITLSPGRRRRVKRSSTSTSPTDG